MSEPRNILQQYWGYDQFRKPQDEVISSILRKEDTVALLPTGGGKSICFQVPALMLEGVCIVISPLIALMKDQVKNLRARNIQAQAVFSGMHPRQIDNIFNNCINGEIKLLYLSPERLQVTSTIEYIRQMNVSFVAVDEAHCIAQWGHDFRPSYRKIAELRSEVLPDLPFMALTASATPEVLRDIVRNLKLKAPNIYTKSFKRDNLSYRILYTEQKYNKLLAAVKNLRGSGIIYCRSRKATYEISKLMTDNQVTCLPYNAGMPQELRDKTQKLWTSDKVRIIAATTAFGMGIDKGDVRFVLHVDVPESLEAYYQEAGRAGRDGELSYCGLLISPADFQHKLDNLNRSVPDINTVKKVYLALSNYYKVALGSGQGAAFPFDLTDFSKKYDIKPILVVNSLKVLENSDYLTVTESVYMPSRVRILLNRLDLYDYQLRNPDMEKLLLVLMRHYPGIMTTYTRISENLISDQLKIDTQKVILQLETLHRKGIIDYQPVTRDPRILFSWHRQNEQYLRINEEWFHNKFEKEKERLFAVKVFLDKKQCKSVIISAYFGEENVEDCGICSYCMAKEPGRDTASSPEERLREVIKDKSLSLEKILDFFSPEEHQTLILVLTRLEEAGYVKRDDFGFFKYVGKV